MLKNLNFETICYWGLNLNLMYAHETEVVTTKKGKENTS